MPIGKLWPGKRLVADTREDGAAGANKSAGTSELVLMEKGLGASLFSGTISGEGVIRARVERSAGESALARLVEEAMADKSPTERLERHSTPAVLG